MLSVLVPAYNEAGSIGKTIEELVKALKEQELDYEVIIIDDGSKDTTREQALLEARAYSNVRVFSYQNNDGKGHALKYGFQFAQGDLVLFLDADSDLSPSQVPRFLEYMSNGNADAIIGSKRHPLSKINYPLTRRLFSKAYNLLVKVLFRLDVSDTQVGIKLFRREVLDQVFPKVLVKRYAFDIELLANARRLGYKIAEAPVELNYQFSSRVSPKAIWGIFVDTLAVFYRMKIQHYYDKKK